MHKHIERILIGFALLVAAVYALISLWPEDKPAPSPTAEVSTREQPAEPSSDSRKSEGEVIANLMKIGSAEMSFRILKKRFGTIEELVRENLLSRIYSDGVIISGYQYSLTAGVENFASYADPATGPGRHYFIDETLDLRYDDNGRASATSLYLSYGKNLQPAAGVPQQPIK